MLNRLCSDLYGLSKMVVAGGLAQRPIRWTDFGALERTPVSYPMSGWVFRSKEKGASLSSCLFMMAAFSGLLLFAMPAMWFLRVPSAVRVMSVTLPS